MELFEAIEQGRVKAVWVIATNPVVSHARCRPGPPRVGQVPTGGQLRHHAAHGYQRAAHVLAPALGWGEKDGTVTSSERRISRQRAFLPAPGEARADWRILCDVATRTRASTASTCPGSAGDDVPRRTRAG
ncbi:molybdopterin-dependent oxidoreductase [Cupriavidus basilensis]